MLLTTCVTISSVLSSVVYKSSSGQDSRGSGDDSVCAPVGTVIFVH